MPKQHGAPHIITQRQVLGCCINGAPSKSSIDVQVLVTIAYVRKHSETPTSTKTGRLKKRPYQIKDCRLSKPPFLLCKGLKVFWNTKVAESQISTPKMTTRI